MTKSYKQLLPLLLTVLLIMVVGLLADVINRRGIQMPHKDDRRA